MEFIHVPKFYAIACTVGAVFLLSACDKSTEPLVPQVDVRSASEPTVRGENLDEAFVRHAKAVPEFAGLWLDAAGRVTINVTNGSATSRVATELAPFISDLRKRLPNVDRQNTQFRVVSYNYTDLSRWRDLLFENTDRFPGFVSLDIDEVNAQVEVGVLTVETARSALVDYQQQAGIPLGAVRIVSATPATVATAAHHVWLSHNMNPMPAGIIVGAQGQGECTYGINVKYNGIPSFITNTHCSAQPAQLDGTPYHQGGTIIGTELADPGLVLCSGTQLCRWSDAVVVQLNGTKTGELGAIARTRFFDPYPPDGGVGDTFIDDAQPRFLMNWPGYPSNPVMGEPTDKVGRITGWIQGPINKTCFDWTGSDGWRRRCTYRFNGEVNLGDSGSTVFHRIVCPGDTWPTVNCATFAGLVWGRTAGQVYFSPTSGLFKDFPGSFEFVSPP